MYVCDEWSVRSVIDGPQCCPEAATIIRQHVRNDRERIKRRDRAKPEGGM